MIVYIMISQYFIILAIFVKIFVKIWKFSGISIIEKQRNWNKNKGGKNKTRKQTSEQRNKQTKNKETIKHKQPHKQCRLFLFGPMQWPEPLRAAKGYK